MALDMEEFKSENERAQKEAQYSGGMKYLELKEGPNVVRIIPNRPPRKLAWVKFKQAYNVGPNQKTVIPAMDENCPYRKELDRLNAQGDELSKKRAAAMGLKNRAGFFVVARAPHPQAGEGPLFFNTNTTHVYPAILAIIADPQYGDITDPEKGVDININYTPGTKTHNGFPAWQILPHRNSSPLGTPQEIAEWTSEDLFDKYDVTGCSEPEYIAACIAGTEQAYIDAKKKAGGGQAQAPQNQVQAPPPPASNAPPTSGSVEVTGPAGKYWVSLDGETKLIESTHVCELLKSGRTNLVMMPENQQGGWTNETALGFKVIQPTPPPVAPVQAPPPAPVAPPPPAAPPAAAAPPPPPAPVAPPPPVVAPPVVEREFYIYENNATLEIKEGALTQKVAGGYSGPVMLKGDTGWKDAAAYGIGAAAPPPPPPSVPGPPAPPSGSSDDDLKRQIEALRASQANGQQSQVSKDLAGQLK